MSRTEFLQKNIALGQVLDDMRAKAGAHKVQMEEGSGDILDGALWLRRIAIGGATFTYNKLYFSFSSFSLARARRLARS